MLADPHQQQHAQQALHRQRDAELPEHGGALPLTSSPTYQHDPLKDLPAAVGGYGGAFASPEPVMNGVSSVLPAVAAASKSNGCGLLPHVYHSCINLWCQTLLLRTVPSWQRRVG